MMLFLRSTSPRFFHGKVISTPTKCIRFHTLRGFNLSHSTRRCQDREQNAAWYVACGTPFLRHAESCYQTLGSVLRMFSCSSGETLATPRHCKCLTQGEVRLLDALRCWPFDIITLDHMKKLMNVFSLETQDTLTTIDLAGSKGLEGIRVNTVKPQKIVFVSPLITV